MPHAESALHVCANGHLTCDQLVHGHIEFCNNYVTLQTMLTLAPFAVLNISDSYKSPIAAKRMCYMRSTEKKPVAACNGWMCLDSPLKCSWMKATGSLWGHSEENSSNNLEISLRFNFIVGQYESSSETIDLCLRVAH